MSPVYCCTVSPDGGIWSGHSATIKMIGNTVNVTNNIPAIILPCVCISFLSKDTLTFSVAINFNLLSEIVGTFVLVFVVFYFTDASIIEQSSPIGLGSLGALPVAFLVWAIGLGLGGTTGYAINPARDLGPRIAHAILPIKEKGTSNWKYAWIPILGPFIGGIIAGLLFLVLNGKGV